MENFEITFSINDLFKRIIKKKKLVLIFFLVFALILGVYKGASLSKSIVGLDEIKSFISENSEEDSFSAFKLRDLAVSGNYSKDILKSALDDGLLSNVNSAVAQYNSYNNNISTYTDILANSVIFNMETVNIPRVILTYRCNSVQNDMVSIFTSNFESAVWDDQTKNEVASILGVDNVDSLVYFDWIENTPNFKVEVVGRSESEANSIAKIIKSKMSETISSFESYWSEYNLSIAFLSEEYLDTVYTRIADERAEYLESIAKCTEGRDKFVSKIDAKILPYFNDITKVQKDMTLEDKNLSDDEFLNKYFAQKTISKSVVKYGVLGGVIGAFIAICYLVLKYLFQHELRRKEDISEVFNLPVIAAFNDNTKEEDIKLLIKDIELSIKSQDKKSCYVSCEGSNDALGLIDKVINGLKKSGIDVYKKINNEKTLEDLSRSDFCILVGKIDKTKYEDIFKSIEMSKRFGTELLGYIVLE